MDDAVLEFAEIDDSGDVRGSSFPVPPQWFAEAFCVRDAHPSSIRPGHTRGDHYHEVRHEILIVMPAGRWSLHWDSGADTMVQYRKFEGTAAVIIKVPPLSSHAIRNDGDTDLYVIGLTDGPYDPDSPDTFPRKVSGT
ncbi:hypothetical protein AB0D74_16485 [Streptomyces sp. NPDC048278]|uniref:polysaccharide biosynthesis C-terminal domain-containing protein n=1 Tax=Streptomyces sp. NPDC048278 TaxID=3155809 RepID=UPI00343EBCBA